jgi:long-chain acyl-CoA synthetase
MDLFQPFIEHNNPIFSSRNVRDLTAALVPEERGAFGYTLDDMNWRYYWMDVHLPGLHKWVFGELDGKMKRVKKVTRARDLVEVFRTAARAFAERKALSHYTHEKGLEVTYTYDEFWEAARRVASWLRAQGVGMGDRVVLMSRNEPAWPMAYVGVLLADASAVPVDPEMPADDVRRIAAKAEAKLVIAHETCEAEFGVPRFAIGDVFEAEPLPDDAIELRDRGNEIASLLFTSGTTGDPKGVMLTHGNFTSLLASLHGTFNVDARDRFLSVLPLFHTFEFSCGMLMPLSVGASITYLEEIDGPLLRSALKDVRPTALIGVPALWDLLYRRIETQVEDRGEAARLAFNSMMRLSRFLRRSYGVNVGPLLFNEVHDTLGGRIRHLISGGASLGDNVMRAFEGLGFELLEGYGLTEAAPVLTVRRPGDRKGGGSVGKPIPSVEVQVVDPDEDGVGEVVARGDNIMMGYLNDPQATADTVRKGWLHTGDLGKLDKDGRLILVGRRKEIIVTSSGKNVYPDELEPLYEDHPQIKELAIVGVPDPQGDERVAALVVLEDDADEEAREDVRAHFQKVAASMPDHKRVRTLKFWHGELPRTATRKVKRKEVRAELMRLLEVEKATQEDGRAIPAGREPAWLYAALAGLAGVDPVDVEPRSDLITDLGLSSLQLVELRSLLEERGGSRVDAEALGNARTVAEVAALVGGKSTALAIVARDAERPATDADKVEVPPPVRTAGRRVLHRAQQAAYDRLFEVKVTGAEHIPLNQQCIVIANHSSHLDMGLVKYALGDYAPNLAALAASDYFFDNKAKRTYFEQFTNLIPVERGGSLETSLAQAESAIRQGKIVLVFPEGTRSRTGELQKFRHGIGYLASQSGLPVLPLWLRGTHRALPKGAAFPTSRRLSAKIGPLIGPEAWRKDVEGLGTAQTYALIAERLQGALEALRDGRPYPWVEAKPTKKAQANGLAAVFDELNGKFRPEKVQGPVTWYFSLGEQADGKWTVSVRTDGCVIKPGRPEGKADCVLKTDPKTFERIVRERYVPGFAEFADGRIKTNDPNLLFTFQNVFGL